VLAALWTVIRGRRWPVMGRKYERARPGAARASAWDVLDQGDDPTIDPTIDPTVDPESDPGPK